MTNPNAMPQPETNPERSDGQTLQDRADAVFAPNHNRIFEEQIDAQRAVKLYFTPHEEKVTIYVKDKVGDTRETREAYYLQGGRLRVGRPTALPLEALDPEEYPDLFDTIDRALDSVETRLADEQQREVDRKQRRTGRIGRSNV